MALKAPSGMNAQLTCIVLAGTRQIAATTADLATFKPGFKGRVVGITAVVGAIGGTTDPDDVDLMVEKGGTDILQAAIAVVDSATLVTGGAVGTLSATTADLEFAATDIFHLDATVDAGTAEAPTIDDTVAYVYVVREGG